MIETNRLLLRPARIEDAHHLFLLNSDPEVIRYTGDEASKSILDCQKMIQERMIEQFDKYQMGRFTVLLKDGTYIGWCGLRFFPSTKEVDLGYRFMKKFWGQGYATEASKACLEYGFNKLNLSRIVAKAMPENVASIKVIRKLGMTFRGYHHDPTDPHPFILYDMTKDEYVQCED